MKIIEMKYIKISIIILLFVLLPIQSSVIDRRINVSNENSEIEVLSVYEIAEIITGAPAYILRAIAITESNENSDAIGDDGMSKGLMQLNEKFHKERADKYGEYDPFIPLDSLIIAGYLYMDNLRKLGDHDLAIAAHRQGVDGVRKYGASKWYINKVKDNLSEDNLIRR